MMTRYFPSARRATAADVARQPCVWAVRCGASAAPAAAAAAAAAAWCALLGAPAAHAPSRRTATTRQEHGHAAAVLPGHDEVSW